MAQYRNSSSFRRDLLLGWFRRGPCSQEDQRVRCGCCFRAPTWPDGPASTCSSGKCTLHLAVWWRTSWRPCIAPAPGANSFTTTRCWRLRTSGRRAGRGSLGRKGPQRLPRPGWAESIASTSPTCLRTSPGLGLELSNISSVSDLSTTNWALCLNSASVAELFHQMKPWAEAQHTRSTDWWGEPEALLFGPPLTLRIP